MILEDKRYLAEDLVDRLSEYTIIGPFATGEEALIAAEEHLPTVGIFDIELKGVLSGIDVAEKLNENATVPIIYLTKIQDDQAIYDRIAAANFPVFFVSKPVSNNELKINLNNAFKALSEQQVEKVDSVGKPVVDVLHDRVLLRHNTGVHSVGMDDLIYVESDGDTTRVFCRGEEYPIVVGTHLKDFLDQLAALSNNVLRVNRFNAVNILKIVRIKDDLKSLSSRKILYLKDTEETLVLSQKYKRELLARFKMI